MSATATPAANPPRRHPAVGAALAILAGATFIAGCGDGPPTSPTVYAGIGLSTTALVTAEGGPNGAIGVALNTPPSLSVDVDLQVSDDTEGRLLKTGSSWASSWVTLTFTPSNWSIAQVVQVVPQNDTLADGNQTYTITAFISWTMDTVYMTVPDRIVAVTNADDDFPGITVSKTTGSTSEAPTTDTFTVKLNTQPTGTVVIPVTSSDTSEGLLLGGSSPTTSQPTINLTFTTANWSVAQTVTVYGQGDLIDDGNQTYSVTVGPPTGAAEYASLTPQTVSVTNIDDDTAGITVTSSPATLLTSENATTATFTVRLNTQPIADVVVAVTSGNVAEGLLSAGVENLVDVVYLTFTPINWAAPQTVTVTGQDEVTTQIPGDNVAYDVTVGPATGDPAYGGLPTQAVHVMNTDNDAAAVIVPAAGGTALQTQETGAGNTVTFSIGINKLPTTNVVIPVTVSDVTEGLVQGGSSPAVPVATLNVTFTPGDFMTAQTITVVGQVDNLVDGNQTYTITVGTPTGDSAYTSLAPQVVSVVNADSDEAGFTVSKTSLTTNEGGVLNTFTAVLNRAPTADVVIPVSSSNAGEGLLAGGSSGGSFVSTLNLTFTSVNWSTPQTVQVQGVVDSVDDGDKTYTITVGPTASTSAPYSGLAAKTVAATNYDADTAGFTVTPLTGLVTTEAGGTATFTVRLTSIPMGTVTIPVSVNDTSEALVSAGGAPANFLYLYFTGTNWSTPQTVTVHGVDDTVADGSVSFAVSAGPTTSGDPKYQALAAKSVAGVNTDDDATNQGSAITPINITGLMPYASQVGSGSSYYMLTGLAAGTSALRLTGVAGDVSLYVYSNSNFSTGLLCQSTTAGVTAREGCSYTVPASGTVYIRVTAVAGTTGSVYTIDQGPPPPTPESEPNDVIASADGPTSGDVTFAGALTNVTGSDYDYYAVNNAGGASATVVFQTYTGSVGSCSYDTVLDLYNSTGTWLSSDDDSGLNNCSLFSYPIPAGTTYYVRVRSFGGSAIPGYLLVIDFP